MSFASFAVKSVLAVQTPLLVEEALETVFARPEFEPAPRSPLWNWLFEAIRATGEFIRGLFPAFAFGQGSATVAFWIVVGLLALGAGLLGLRLVERLLARRSRRGGATAAPPADAGGTLPQSAEEWERHARALAAAGQWREAALALYQALLHRLDARGALRFDPAKTPGDYRRESRKHPESYRLLDGFLRRFEPVAFGGRVADASAFDRLMEAAGLAPRNG